jgi:hypothetical protein
MKLCKNIVTIGFENTCNRRIGLTIIHIDCIQLSTHGQGAISANGLIDRSMSLHHGQGCHILVAILGQETLSKSTYAVFIGFLSFPCSYCHSNESM